MQADKDTERREFDIYAQIIEEEINIKPDKKSNPSILSTTQRDN
jgi:hypothetical protein